MDQPARRRSNGPRGTRTGAGAPVGRRIAASAAALLLPALAVACDGGSVSGPEAPGRLQVQFRGGGAASAALASMSATDPAVGADRLSMDAVESVDVTLSGVEVRFVGPDSADADSADADSTGAADERWVSLELQSADSAGGSEQVVLDLTELPSSGGVTVAAADLEPGTYRGLRLRFETAELVLADSATLGGGGGAGGRSYGPGSYDLFVPSGQQTGIKVPTAAFTVDAETGAAVDVLADAEASIQGIRVTGRGFLMTPVLTADAETEED